ncbi:IgGFc-binding protein-like [Ruditapes philippinarum]|uniref:IgGFc-binding protein-like n=1 Tax=Ruditapes philippinarum TaxID=129788 RepID=UPI00295BA410|nr:IgGFc-binding protein-like [Ruditapes philippinarum]
MKGILCFFLILIAKCATSTSQQCSASSVGKRFVFGIIGFDSIYTGSYLRLHITPTEQVQAHVQINAPSSNLDKIINVSNYTIFVLNLTQVQFEEGKKFKGIEVISDVNVSVRILAGDDYYYEGFLALPLTALGTHYVALSYKPYSSYSSEILVVGIESETSVSISTMLNGYQGSNTTFQLQKFESYQFKANHDISGSVVVSSKPVAVISGSALAQVPSGIGDYKYLIEQMIPTKYWTTKFIIPPIYPRLYFVLRFFAEHNNTEIQYHNSTKHYAVYLSNKDQWRRILFAN